MGAPKDFNKLKNDLSVQLNNTLTSGITKVDGTKPISELKDFATNGALCKAHIRVNQLSVASASSAALAWGEHVFSYPSGMGLVLPIASTIKMLSTTDAAQAATAGEIGLGTTIASGANATLGAVAEGAEDVMEGKTIANHVADTELTSEEAGVPVSGFDHGAGDLSGIQDASASAVDVHFNIATTYDNASTNATVFEADIIHWYMVLGENFGVW